jgi:alpha-mannosidase
LPLILAGAELYLELHRGTATSHGSIKKGNRKSEILLREIEYAATLASVWGPSKASYEFPKDKLHPLWEGVLLNQFHDVLPGSAIGMVYTDAEKVSLPLRQHFRRTRSDPLPLRSTPTLFRKALRCLKRRFKL